LPGDDDFRSLVLAITPTVSEFSIEQEQGQAIYRRLPSSFRALAILRKIGLSDTKKRLR
jgi:hypothetical protein